jgi:hypothetical protein
MTIWRWKHDPSLNFPPAHIVNGIEYNDLNRADAWMAARPARRGQPQTQADEPAAVTI